MQKKWGALTRNTLITLFLLYIIIRFYCTSWLDSFVPYSSYIFELALIITSIALTWPKIKSSCQINKIIFCLALLSTGLGFLSFSGAQLLQIPIPFSFSNYETLILLLVVAPILEEFIFRFFSWEAISGLSKPIAFLGTSLLFSYSHLHSIWFVPEEIHRFIYYQTAYTLVLGAICGFSIWRYNSLIGAILLHLTFNLGFYLGSLV